MKNFLKLFSITILFFSCEKPSECIESFGKTITKEIIVEPFLNIKVFQGIELVITQGPDYKVEIEAGENFIDNVEVTRNGNEIIFKDNTSCNWVRQNGKTKVYITAPNIEDIYSKTDRNISSNGVLTFPIIRLYAFDSDADGIKGSGTGDFYFEVNNTQIVIQENNVARFYLSGATDNALYNIYFGDGRIEAENLVAKEIIVFHRGSNDMVVYPTEKITGKMISTGNIILKNVPPITIVEQLYNGHLIYP